MSLEKLKKKYEFKANLHIVDSADIGTHNLGEGVFNLALVESEQVDVELPVVDLDDHRNAPGSSPLESRRDSGQDVAHTSCHPALTSWRDSAPVMRLSEYLKEHKNRGIKLYQSDSRPCLSFDPALRGGKDMDLERWQIAVNAIDLLLDAEADLKHLITRGLLDLPDLSDLSDLPEHPHESHRAAAGPSGRPAMHGSRRPV